MRIGSNPEKSNKEIIVENYHRVIIPVYIPNFEGYFEHQFEVFKLCLESLILTVHNKTRITIYNNNSNSVVKKYIDEKFVESQFIDQVFHSKENLGKINAILAAAKGNLEPLITITDADVLFKNGWQQAVEQTFISFPEAGMVSPVPSSKVYKMFTSNNWYYGLFKGKLAFEKVIDSEGMHRFDLSLGNKELMYKPIHLDKYLILSNKKGKAVMGCGHFVATFKREILDLGSIHPSKIKIGGKIVSKYLDIPNEKLGCLRLATKGNYAYHMGNQIEDWMQEEFKLLKKSNNETTYTGCEFKFVPISSFGKFVGVLIKKLLNKNKKINIQLLKKLGLSSEEANEY